MLHRTLFGVLLLTSLSLAPLPAASANPSPTFPTYTCDFLGAAAPEVGCPPALGTAPGSTLVFHDHDTQFYFPGSTTCTATPGPLPPGSSMCVHRLVVREIVAGSPTTVATLINACVQATFANDIVVSTPAPNTPLGPYKITMKADAVYEWTWSFPQPVPTTGCAPLNDAIVASGGASSTRFSLGLPSPTVPGACGNFNNQLTPPTHVQKISYPDCGGTLPHGGPDCAGVYDDVDTGSALSFGTITPYGTICKRPDGGKSICIGAIRQPPGRYDETCIHTTGPCLVSQDGGNVYEQSYQPTERSDVFGNTYQAPRRDFDTQYDTCTVARNVNA
jgi:hypothetical protein